MSNRADACSISRLIDLHILLFKHEDELWMGFQKLPGNGETVLWL